MDEHSVTRIILHQYHPSFSYTERETAQSCHLSIRTLRHLRALGLVEGQETDGALRYSEEEIIQLRKIRRLQHDLGINLAGIEVILHLLNRLEAIYQELEKEREQK